MIDLLVFVHICTITFIPVSRNQMLIKKNGLSGIDTIK